MQTKGMFTDPEKIKEANDAWVKIEERCSSDIDTRCTTEMEATLL